MDLAPTQYIDRDGAAMAYQVVGDGPNNVVNYWEMFQHLDLTWTDPDTHHYLFERGAGFSRSLYFQRRGFGLSDRITYVPSLEQQAEDVLALMDAAGMERATLVGATTTCGPLAMVAATVPERVKAMVLITPLSFRREPGGDPVGWPPGGLDEYLEKYRQAFANWGSGEMITLWDSTQDTPRNRRLSALLERSSATPGAALAFYEWGSRLDYNDVLQAIPVPTRVVHLPTNPAPAAAIKHLASLIPHATFHLLPPTLPGATIGQAWVPILDHVEEVTTGAPHPVDAERYLGTVLFTDLVSSTELLEQLGDTQYRQTRGDHERQVRLAVENAGGRVISVAGDGSLSVFDSPTSAVRCADAICREAEEVGLSVRAGIHTGEIERDVMDVTGLTVHIGARVGAAAGPGEVLVSRTVRDLVAGSGLAFLSQGEQQLKGVSGAWELFALKQPDGRDELAAEESMQTPMDRLALQSAQRVPGLVRAAVRLGNAIERRRART